MRRTQAICAALVLWSGLVFLLPAAAWAVPAFARRYGVTCSTCHSAWPALNATGWSFMMSGYRRLNGRDLQPTTKDIELAMEALTIPAIPPLAVTATTGFDFQEIGRRAADGTKANQTGSSLDMNAVELFAAAPLGKNLSTFLEFPLFETKAPDNDRPVGPADADSTGREFRRNIQFETESPTFEKGKLLWNSLLPETIAPLDSLNILGGVDELPFAFSPEGRRLSVRSYLIYRRRALDLLSPTTLDGLLTGAGEGDRFFRFGEPQIQVALNGVLVPFGVLTDLAKPQAFVLEYHLGIANGSNNKADANTQKDFFGRLAIRWWGQTLGVFGYKSPDTYDDAIRDDGSISLNPSGIFSGAQRRNSLSSVGPDLTLSLEPFDIPLWLETQALFNRESDPTGFKKSFAWWGGFTQLNWKVLKRVILYGRYDWLRGNRFDDTGEGGVTGPVRPREWAAVGGIQWYVLENFKLLAEYSRHEFRNNLSTPSSQKINENFFTVRASLGF